jgi:outer membrane protein assembly factor BamB
MQFCIKRTKKSAYFYLLTVFMLGLGACDRNNTVNTKAISPPLPLTPPPLPAYDPNRAEFVDEYGQKQQIELINPTFLNNAERNYYGANPPDSLKLIWKHYLGVGTTQVKGLVNWAGAGWTGQPLMVLENGKKFIIQGAYDHHLKKIRADSGKLVWQYKYEDVLKGTGTIWIDPKTNRRDEKMVILQGSRSGTTLDAGQVFSYRGVNYFSGQELWRLNSARTRCYSRDVDASALVLGDTAYLGLENGLFTVFSPALRNARTEKTYKLPLIYRQKDTLYKRTDALLHGGNLVTEASPSRIGNYVYIASGSGYVWGYNILKDTIDWSFFIGSDIDGSPVVTSDSCLLIAVEKQYIKGKGGILKLNPRKEGRAAIVWYYPTGDYMFADWQGGVIGSCATNEKSKKSTDRAMGACVGIDGFLHVFSLQDTVPNQSVLSFDGLTKVATPQPIFTYQMGQSIATPAFIGDKIIALGYGGLYMFEQRAKEIFRMHSRVDIRGEATPFVDDKRVYVASRDGYLYCFGDK